MSQAETNPRAIGQQETNMSFGRLGLDELVPSRYALNREPLVATHLSFPSVWHVAVAGDVFR